MKILILTGKFGMGHWSAAQSLSQQLQRQCPGSQVEIVDFPEYALPEVSKYMYRGFEALVTHASQLFNIYYKFTYRAQPELNPVLERLLQDRLIALLGEAKPDAVISTHPLCAQVATGLRRQEGLDLPLITCVTDVTDHPEWICAGTDCYLVANRLVKERLVNRGIDEENIIVTGIPVSQRFHHLAYRRGGGQRQLLIMGGGLGMLPKKERFYQELNALPGVHTTIITGKNQKLYHQLYGKYQNIEVVGYTQQVPEYMARADLLVTKPGGITLYETLFAQLPLLVWPPQLEQEKYNARWMIQAGIGWVMEDGESVEEIRAVLYDDVALGRASAQMRELKGQLERESLTRLMEAIEHGRMVCA